MEEPYRVRLIFENPKILSKPQILHGLDNSWLLLNSKISTISDLASYVCKKFSLKHSCPNGILLFMDNFVLPPFESTCVLKDNDIIRVRKKDVNHPHYIQNSGVEEKEHTVSTDKFLAIEEFGEDSGDHKGNNTGDPCAHNETDAGTSSKSKKKRKYSDDLQVSKKKKLKADSKKLITVYGKDDDPPEEEFVHHANSSDVSKKEVSSPKNCYKKDKEQVSISVPKERRRKKSQSISPEKEFVSAKGAENITIVQSQGTSQKRESSKKRLRVRDKQSDEAEKSNAVIASQPQDCATKEINSVLRDERKKKLKADSRKSITSCGKDEETYEEEFIHLANDLDSSKNKVCSSESDKLKDKEHAPSSVLKEKRRRKSQPVIPEMEFLSTHGAENISTEQSQGNSQMQDISKKRLHNKDKQSDEVVKSNLVIASQLEDGVSKKINSELINERIVQAEDDIEENICEPHGVVCVPKVLSRSARRKKAKRKWARELGSHEKQKIQNQIPIEVIQQESPKQQEAEQNTELEKEIVPVVVRPGHIRFQPLDEEQSEKPSQTQELMEKFQWNGTTSKKKGQKWGLEKTKSYYNDVNGHKEQTSDATNEWNNTTCHNERSNGKENSMNKLNESIVSEKLCSGKANDCEENSNGKTVSEKVKSGNVTEDFESLFPLIRIPQVGDLLAYRLIELSSSWCPVVSPFRVGLVSSYDCVSLNIVLVSVPEYPIFLNEDTEEKDDMLQANPSLYNEDGSLQIHYPQLIDVRLLKASDLEAANLNNSGRDVITTEAVPANNSEPALASSIITQEIVAHPTETESVVDSSWDEIKKALEKKKAELQRRSTASPSWSYRALRKSAVGPTLAYLREKNDDQSEKS